jgi:uncharacterized membrane protein
MSLSYNRIASHGVERVAALADGVFAFAMTVLVLDIRVPVPESIHSEGQLFHALLGLTPRLVMYLMSFLTLGIFWNGQQTVVNYVAEGDRNFAWLQIAFLAAVVLIPFSTGLLAEFMTFRVALLVYWLNILALGAILYGTWRYARRAKLIKGDVTDEITCAIERRILVSQSCYAAGAALCVISPYVSIAVIVLFQLNYALAPRIRFLYQH